ncbi:MAG: sodium/proton-translocating pyrophosphatase [Phycisphaeraceae bacterium]|nr:sodium/proton-translocating pyrophosphatase [Phycisphaeraceae bacterium]
MIALGSLGLSLAQGSAVISGPSLPAAFYLAPLGGVMALIAAYLFYASIVRQTEGEPEMIRIAAAVRAGAYAYLSRQRKVVAIVFAVLVLVLLGVSFGLNLQPALSALGVPVAGFFSGLCGYFGMKTATSASARTAAAAKRSLNDGLKVAFRAGAVMGLCVTGFAILDVSTWFYLLTQVFPGPFHGSLAAITTVTLSFAMGASLQALFARVGGGIYTKAADVGADLVGKVEAGIPEDDARNPATIADNVGDNVGDVAGMGADLYESYYGAILAAMALAAAAAVRLGLDPSQSLRLVIIPPALAGLGIIASIFSIFLIRTKEGASLAQLLRSLGVGVWASSLLITIGSAFLLRALLADVPGVWSWGIWLSILSGLDAGLVIAKGTEFYTSYDHHPTQRIAEQAQTGPATVIIAGIAEGMMSTWIPLLTIVVAILVAFLASGGNETFLMGVFGVGLAAVGMLSTLAITLATDAYGPIADNAGGNAEMSHQPSFVRQRTDMLDSLGNTTAATGKGFAIGSAALTAMALLAAYVTTAQQSLVQQVLRSQVVISAEKPTAYLHHGLFIVENPQLTTAESAGRDAGVLLAAHNRKRIEEALGGGAAYTAEYVPALGHYEAKLTTTVNDRPTNLVFEILPVSTSPLPRFLSFYDVSIMNPRLLGGLFLGVMVVFLFCALTMNAVGRSAFAMMQECRRQFAIMRQAFAAKGMSAADIADPRKWPYSIEHEGKSYPDYANCVDISTRGAQREMVVPAILAVVIPVTVGLTMGVAGTMGMLAGALISGFAVAIFMANAGGAWDNAKKYIESGQYGGKGSEAHKAGVVGDTVGDPFKDTAGPALNILIKLMSVVSVVFAGLIVRFAPMVADWLRL